MDPDRALDVACGGRGYQEVGQAGNRRVVGAAVGTEESGEVGVWRPTGLRTLQMLHLPSFRRWLEEEEAAGALVVVDGGIDPPLFSRVGLCAVSSGDVSMWRFGARCRPAVCGGSVVRGAFWSRSFHRHEDEGVAVC